MLLGDASLIVYKGKDAYLQYKHSARQRQYALYKAEVLRGLTHVRVYERSAVDGRTGNTYHSVSVITRRHPLYSRLHRDWYSSGRKAVHPFWLEKLDERGLAFWFFDDGSTTRKYRWKGSTAPTVTAYIATLAFSWPENYLLSTFLHKRFGIHTSVRRWQKGKPILYVQTKSHSRLREVLLPFAADCGMTYKLPDERPLESSG
jgi:hypothetical protein